MSTVVLQLLSAVPGAAALPPTVEQVRRQLGLRIEPQFPGATDLDLASYFVAALPAAADAEATAETLRSLPEVAAAYVQPEPSQPSP